MIHRSKNPYIDGKTQQCKNLTRMAQKLGFVTQHMWIIHRYLLVVLHATSASSCEETFTEQRRLYHGPRWTSTICSTTNVTGCQENYLHTDGWMRPLQLPHFLFNWSFIQWHWQCLAWGPPKAPTTVTMFIWDNNSAHNMYISKEQNICKTSLFYQNVQLEPIYLAF